MKYGREVLSNVIDTQISIHEKFGGVVPEIASRNHVEAISVVTKKALEEAKISFEQVDAIACTYGPGLVGALLVGVSYAKALSYSINRPLVGVNHLKGHIAANYITYPELEPPFLCMMMSGGNTQIVLVNDYTEFKVLGKTRDDAIGEAFDKVARVIGLGYPGGPKIDKLAKEGTANIKLPKTHLDNLDFSFSGIKTAVINLHHKNPDVNKSDLCASFEKAVTDVLIGNIKKAIEITNIKKVVLAGGVSANSYIRSAFDEFSQKEKTKIYYPELKLCTDNAAMIASAGYYEFINGRVDSLELNAVPNLKKIEEKGISISNVTLHVGIGTFRPVKEKNIEDHHMHTEHYYIKSEDAEKINKAKREGHKVIAVGTTSCRTIETIADENGYVKECEGDTSIYIYPGYKFKCLDGLITNFHLPESTLLMLVSALAGKENIMNAYEEAVKEKYKFFSFGDAMFIK